MSVARGLARTVAVAAALALLVGFRSGGTAADTAPPWSRAVSAPSSPARPMPRPRPAVSPPSSAARAAAALGLSADELDAILAHGPWPPPPARDPTNRVSGDAAAIELGRRLFAETRASIDGTRSCATCHRPERAFAEPRPRSLGADGGTLDRNAPTLLDVRLLPWLGWDGAADSLWSFVLRPLADPRELGADDARLAALFAADPTLACLRRTAFGDAAPPPGVALRVQVAKAIAAHLETLVSPRTPFDALRDALAAGDAAAARTYPADALRGLRRFVGDGRCALCHVGPAFTSGEFHDAGRPHMAAPGRPDRGRHGGAIAVMADPFNRLGRWSDAADPAASVRTRHLAPSHRNFGEFRVPGLRMAAATAPYGHDGSMATLADVVAHYSELDVERLHADGEALLRPLRLDPAASAELVAFLRSLSAPLPAPSPVRPPPPAVAACVPKAGS